MKKNYLVQAKGYDIES